VSIACQSPLQRRQDCGGGGHVAMGWIVPAADRCYAVNHGNSAGCRPSTDEDSANRARYITGIRATPGDYRAYSVHFIRSYESGITDREPFRAGFFAFGHPTWRPWRCRCACVAWMNLKNTEELGEATPAKRRKLLSSPWQRRGIRSSGDRKWLPNTENSRGALDARRETPW